MAKDQKKVGAGGIFQAYLWIGGIVDDFMGDAMKSNGFPEFDKYRSPWQHASLAAEAMILAAKIILGED
jgi:hypothetical protein